MLIIPAFTLQQDCYLPTSETLSVGLHDTKPDEALLERKCEAYLW